MYYPSLLILTAFAASVHSHGVILKAQGEKGSVASQGFLGELIPFPSAQDSERLPLLGDYSNQILFPVNNALARNCTDISPCQLDSTIIRDEEIRQNIVNGCGRTELNGNIDIGEQTENELAANRVTSVKKGSVLSVTIHQVNADGAGPYTCDLDQTSNANTNFVPLKVTDNVPGVNGLSQAKFQNFVMKVALPDDLNCIGGSTGNVCTVRCRNNALAGPFGGCFAVQQTDNAGRTNTSAAAVTTAQTLEDISRQIQVNQEDLDAAIAANQAAGLDGSDSGVAAIAALTSAVPAATTTASAATSQSNSSGTRKHGNGNGNRNGNRRVEVRFSA
ncbi:hypothetical protein VTN00DRAFT_2642 [Thermoascus crustaceus]|uniref:uncharacterized protein n=1 Tax=Thermoascus crustaceus TaxID=5088 RepID=UPI0037425F3D